MTTPKPVSDRLRTFYDDHLRALEFGNAVADVILVPLLALNLVGVIAIRGRFTPEIVAIFAFIDVTSTAILLVAGYIGPASPRIACSECRTAMVPEISGWHCPKCSLRLKAQKPAPRAKTDTSPPN